jgi:hypothetical protein
LLRIAAIRENIRELIEQAAAFSGAGDEARTADRIADQEAQLSALIKQREDFAGEGTAIRAEGSRSVAAIGESECKRYGSSSLCL